MKNWLRSATQKNGVERKDYKGVCTGILGNN